MKKFFWKPFIIDPEKPAHKEVVWAKVKQHDIDDNFMQEVVAAFHDKRAAAAKESDSGAATEQATTIQVTSTLKKSYFSPEESKTI